ncbi:VOC family protein [Mycobacterium sp.]|uniref:VOC family protein n=1 Tax=Mycobacterium sp. TaxID=1785 RepID=UPI002B8AA710|nr:VOC family protein [Mycobacterium sp.]HME50104.1 VOC family protein [Mycobacterium sp.]
MNAIAMAGLLVEAADPGEVAGFWGSALGGEVRPLLDGAVQVRGDFPELTCYAQPEPKAVKNRVHLDLYVAAVEPLLALGARLLDEYGPDRVTLADVEGNEFCAFLTPQAPSSPPARVFAVCTDSDRPEELAAWWAPLVSARIDAGTDGTPRWLSGPAGWPGLIWKFVRVADPRVAPNRWRWTVRGDTRRLIAAGARVAEAGVLLDPAGNEFSVTD